MKLYICLLLMIINVGCSLKFQKDVSDIKSYKNRHKREEERVNETLHFGPGPEDEEGTVVPEPPPIIKIVPRERKPKNQPDNSSWWSW